MRHGLVQSATSPPPDVRERRSDAPPAFASAIARCLEWRREARWATAQEAVAAALR